MAGALCTCEVVTTMTCQQEPSDKPNCRPLLRHALLRKPSDSFKTCYSTCLDLPQSLQRTPKNDFALICLLCQQSHL